LPAQLAFGALCLLLVVAPQYLSGFWPASLDLMAGAAYLPLAMFLSLTACVGLLLALGGKTAAVGDEPRKRFAQPVMWLLAAFLMWNCLSAVTTVHRHDTFLELARVGGCIVWFFVARSFLCVPNEGDSTRRLWVFSAIVAGAVLAAAPAVLRYAVSRQPQPSSFYNTNLFANYCAMSIPVALGWAVLVARAAKARRPGSSPLPALIPALLPALILAFGLLASSSKGGLLSLLVGVLVFFIAAWRAQSRAIIALVRANIVVVGILGLLLLVGGGAVFSKTVLPRIQEASSFSDHSTMFRVYIWRATVDMASARPVLGWGPGSFPVAFSQFAIAGPTRSAHQLWLQLAAEGGWLSLLFLGGACLTAMVSFWKALRSIHWPIAAAGLGALSAFAVHGMTDSGWSMTSIVILLMVLLAFSETPQPKASMERERVSALHWPWLIAALACALGAATMQKAIRGEDLRYEAEELARKQEPRQALEKAREAKDADPLSGRAWIFYALSQGANGENAMPSFEQAIRLQPTRAESYLSVARYLDKTAPTDTSRIASYYDRAIALDHNNSRMRLERARWRLAHKDLGAWDDFEYVAKLADEPYGKHPAIVQFVNLDFAEAYIQLVPRLLQRGEIARAKAMVEAGLEDVELARHYEAETAELRRIMPGSEDDEEKLNEVEASLNLLAKKVATLSMEKPKP